MSNIRTACLMRGINQTQLAEAVGCTPQQINALVTGSRKPGPKQLPLLSDALGVSAAYLRGEPQTLAVYDWGTGGTAACPIMTEEAIGGYGCRYVVDHPDVGPLAVILSTGMQFTPRDWQGAQPLTAEDVAETAWVDAYGRDALMIDGLPRVMPMLGHLTDKEEIRMKKFYIAEFQTDEPIDLRVFAGFDRDEAVTEAAAEWRHLTDREKAKRQLTVLAIDVPETCETVEDAEAWLDAEDRWGLGGEAVLELGR